MVAPAKGMLSHLCAPSDQSQTQPMLSTVPRPTRSHMLPLHRFLNKTFGVTPRVGWNLDNFGHSSTAAGLLLGLAGYEAVFFARADYKVGGGGAHASWAARMGCEAWVSVQAAMRRTVKNHVHGCQMVRVVHACCEIAVLLQQRC